MSLTISVDSFISLADAETYWSTHSGGDYWDAATPGDKESALMEASQYIDKSFNFIGHHPRTVSQLLSWPRINAYDKQGRYRSGIPQEVKDATCWLANEALNGHLRPSKERGGQIESIMAGGRTGVQVTYEKGAPSQKSFDYVTLLLSDLTVGSGKNARILKV